MIEATRQAGLDRLTTFVAQAGRAYRSTRNEDRGPEDRSNVSMLAPYVRSRLIGEDEVLRATLGRHTLASSEKFVQEVFWRTYWKGWLESRPIVWEHYRRDLDVAREAARADADLARRLADAEAGRTANPAFDAWAHELVATNYLHNHARMWFASIWIFTLQLPWELGADFFMRHLYCGDPASNTLSWRWVAGLQTRGKTYLATRDNIRRYTNGRLDPGTHLATAARALDGPSYSPGKLPDLVRDAPTDESAMLVLHDDDAGADMLALHRLDVRTTVGMLAVHGRSPEPMAPEVVAFARGAIEDGITRAPHPSGAVFEVADTAALARSFVTHAREHDATCIVVPYAPVGPVRDALRAIEPALAAAGMRVHQIGRPFDAAVWPYATRGFFHLKEHIPRLVDALGLAHAG
ncbi:MAG: hypothetical protein NVS1B2_02970 [Vulcanimicrobiaceae bacterium]